MILIKMAESKYIERIAESLQQVNPYKIILFGSHVYGNPKKNSDIDLIVVLNNNDMPKTFKKKLNTHTQLPHN